MEPILDQIYSSVLRGKHKEISRQVMIAIHQGIPAGSILKWGMIDAMTEVGRLFESGEYYVPEMLVSARAMQTGLNTLKPHLAEGEIYPSGKIAIGSVQGDFHDIGKNLVKMMLEGSGFEVIDLGVDVSPESFLSSLIDHNVEIIALSALTTITMQAMHPVISLLDSSPKRKWVKIMVGGAPLTEDFARKIGADGYASDASQAVTLARSLLSENPIT